MCFYGLGKLLFHGEMSDKEPLIPRDSLLLLGFCATLCTFYPFPYSFLLERVMHLGKMLEFWSKFSLKPLSQPAKLAQNESFWLKTSRKIYKNLSS